MTRPASTSLRHRFIASLLCLLGCLAASLSGGPSIGSGGTAAAAEVPDFEREVVLAAREQPVAGFLERLLGNVGVPVRVDEAIRGTVNGDFDAPASEIFDDISTTFGLTMYYDGAVAWIYPASETVRNVVRVSGSNGQRVIGSAESLGMLDSRNRLDMSPVGLIVTGTERFAEQVNELVAAVGPGVVAAPEPVPGEDSRSIMRVFRLKYAWAGDVLFAVGDQDVLVPGVASLLRGLIEPGALNGAPEVRRTTRPRSLPGLRGEGLRSIGTESVRSDGDVGVATTAPLPVPSADDDGSTADTRIVADTLNNAVVIRDRADRMAGYEELIAALDVEPEMVEIEATIIDLDTNRLRELGVNWRVQGDDGEILVGEGTAADRELVEGGDIAGRGQGGIVSLVLGDETRFLSRIRALETQGAARVVSKPHVMTLSNVEALLDTTSTFFVRVEGEEEVDLFDVSVGTTLRVTPHVFDGERGARIRLRVNIEDGSTTDRSVDRIPIIERSTINTQALVNQGDSLLIGGLVREFDGNGVSKVPLLGSIPVLGALFRNSTQSSDRIERMFLISPRVNLRATQGPRYSVPLAEGAEDDIIRSAPSRTAATQAALASRDDAWPVEPALPPAGGEARLTREDARRAPDVPPPIEPVVPPRERSLRERIGLDEPAGRPETVVPPDRPRTAPPPSWPDGWQEVGAEPLEIEPEAASPVALGSSSERDASSVPASPDEWQEVVR